MKTFKSVKSIKRAVNTFFLMFSFLIGIMVVNILPASAQLSDLTSWYIAMNSTDGNRVSLFSNDVSYLMANNAIWGGTGLILGYPEASKPWKNSYVKKWNSSSQSLSWNINSSVEGNYYIDALMKQNKGITVRIQVGSNILDKTLPGDILDKVAMGQIFIPQGNSTLTISVPAGTFEMTIFSLELYPAAAKPAIDKKIADGRSKATWMSKAPMGMMYQWGQWGANQKGQGSAWPSCYEKMDWAAFAQRLKDEGADFLVWSITFGRYYVAAPIKSIDNLLPGRTCETDYLNTLLTECRNRGIKVIFYYHAGHDDKPWWNSFWNVTATSRGVYVRKDTAMYKWMNVISEIGNRYGSKLAGWLFDDGGIYYPAPFDKLNAAAKAGYADRIMSFNSAYVFDFTARMTEYEDYYFGETTPWSGMKKWPTDDNGVYTSGPFLGVHAFANLQTEESGWGITASRRNISIATSLSQNTFNTYAIESKNNHFCTAFNFRMFEDGTQSEASLDRFRIAAYLAHGESVPPYSDYLGAGHSYEVTVTTSSNADDVSSPGIKTVDGSGLLGNVHDTLSNNDWSSKSSTDQWIKFDLGKTYALDSTHIWNGNKVPEKGLKVVDISYSTDGANFKKLVTATFPKASGSLDYIGFAGPGFHGVKARFIKFMVKSNYDDSNGVQLGEVKFYVN
jgi:hypothetical protein